VQTKKVWGVRDEAAFHEDPERGPGVTAPASFAGMIIFLAMAEGWNTLL